MMKVSRNWPSAIMGLMVGAIALSPVGANRGFAGRCEGAIAGSVRWRCRSSVRSGCLSVRPAAGIDAVVRVRQRQRRRLRRQTARGLELQLRRGSAAEGVAERPADQLVDVRLVAKAHFGFRRVHVDVHRVVRHLDEEMHLRAALLDRRLAVGVDDGVRHRAVLDDAAVDEQVLRTARRPLLGQRRDVAEQLDVAAVATHLDQVAAIAVQLIEPLPQRGHRRALQHLAPGARQREADLRVAQRQLRDDDARSAPTRRRRT